MVVSINSNCRFKMPYTRNRIDVLKAKILYLRKYNYSDALIESLMYANNYGMKEINEQL